MKKLFIPLVCLILACSDDDMDNSSNANALFPDGTVHCDPSNPTEVVDVTNLITGKTWMDRNLGASQVATSSTDVAAYGDLYQWGRAADGHQCRDSQIISTLSSTDQPEHGNFILIGNNTFDWRSPQNDNLWKSSSSQNNPCPKGYRIPTLAELETERQSWSSDDRVGAIESPLKLPAAGVRSPGYDGELLDVGVDGEYWSSSVYSVVSGTNSNNTTDSGFSSIIYFGNGNAGTSVIARAQGRSVRCIKD